MRVEKDITVQNEHGLHARPAMQVVDTANRFACDLTLTKAAGEVEREDTVADAKSVMAVITLAATRGTTLHLVADGEDAQAAADALAGLFDDRFGEV